jgi:hypothetical protein
LNSQFGRSACNSLDGHLRFFPKKEFDRDLRIGLKLAQSGSKRLPFHRILRLVSTLSYFC